MSDPERLTADDLAAALDSEELGEELGELDQLILDEVKKRLGDPDARSSLPGTVLMQLARDVMKVRQVEAARKVEQVEEPLGLGDIIDAAGLPDDRKRELIRREILRVSAELDQLNGMLDGLEGK